MKDLKKIGRHAISVLVGQWAVVGFALIDSAIAGHINEVELAALSIGAAIFMTVFVALLGAVQAILPIAGQLYGAKRYPEIGYQCRQTLYLAAWVSVIGLVCLLFPKPLFVIAQVDPERQALIQGYLNMLAIGFVPAVYFRVYVSVNQAISRPLFVTILQVGALIFKAPLAWFLAIKMEMGIAGCSLSSSILNCAFILIAIVMLFFHPIYKKLELFKKMEPPRWKDQKDLMRLGIPMGLSNFIEVAGSTFMALFIAHFKSDIFQSAHQLMIQLSSTIFQIPLSVGIATSAIVAQYIGARKMSHARSAAFLGVKLSIGCTVVAVLLVVLFRSTFLGLLTDNQEVLLTASSLILFVAAYQVVDSAQVTAAFALRSYRIAILPTIMYAISLWGIGLTGGYLIAFDKLGNSPQIMQGPGGFWFMSSVGLAICAVVLNALLYRIATKKISDV